MHRTEKEIKKEIDRRGSASHSKTCGFPSDPCNCEVYNKRERRKRHAGWCFYPSEPCCCDLI